MAEFRAFAAIGHVLRSTFGNLGFAVRMSWPWMTFILIIQVVTIFLFPKLQSAMMSGDLQSLVLSPQLIILTFVSLIGNLFAFSSIAVNWHRYILLDEEPEGWEKLRLDSPVMSYIGNLFLGQIFLMVVFVGAALAVAAVGIALQAALPANLGKTLIVLMFFAMWLFLIVFAQRLFIKLPAVAIEREDYGFRDALADTKGHELRLLGFVFLFFLLVFLLVFMATLPAAVLILALGKDSIAGLLAGSLIQFGANWVGVIMSVTSLTTLYGIFAEGRQV